ncbi:deferrochelatase/peroxidase EfeB [Geodermatophilus telluris]|uniref:Deferrochelatase/peroxidase EfeB n=1 Tax=Geodermatophilus telluris TaxID=1190417 RepID=A0A1G6V5I9_9ACTN|nr:deferrochelatase/peroxidase EfeB [Geodermatophilus telluris]
MPDLADVQGLVLRGYGMPHARHLVLRVDAAPAGRELLGSLVDGTPGRPQVTPGTPWTGKPECCLNVAVTAGGLRALGVPDESLATFPEEFTAGAVARAGWVGDVGPAAPEHWLPVFRDPGFHLLVSLSGQSAAAVERATDALLAGTAPGVRELGRFDAALLGGRVDHFGYVDGISQPTVEGAPPPGPPDRLPVAPAGAFLLGHPSQFPGHTYPVPQPEVLGRDGSFAAFRVLAQDVDAFVDLLAEQSRRTGADPELVAAWLCGRWRTGVPLVLSPHTGSPDPPLPPEALNDFGYADDPRGERCPIGSHVRRVHPRDSRVAGGGGHRHRVVRRGLPYGPPYDPAHPRDGHERGLLGLFLGVSLRDQFEFVMREWVIDGRFAPGLGRTQDPFLGAGGTLPLAIPGGGRTALTGLPRLVTTRGGAYCFVPSLPAIAHLAGRATGTSTTAGPAGRRTSAVMDGVGATPSAPASRSRKDA